MENNLEKCFNYKCSRSQREEERARGQGDAGTRGYEKMGCYECDGLEKECRAYFAKRRVAE